MVQGFAEHDWQRHRGHCQPSPGGHLPIWANLQPGKGNAARGAGRNEEEEAEGRRSPRRAYHPPGVCPEKPARHDGKTGADTARRRWSRRQDALVSHGSGQWAPGK